MGYDLHVTGPGTRTVIALQGDAATLTQCALPAPIPPWPGRPNSRTRRELVSLLWIAPARWLVLAPLVQEDALQAALGRANGATVTVLSDSLAFFALSGADADAAMAIACPLDLDARVFGHDSASFTDAFGTRALVQREGPGWTLAVECSYAAYVGAYLRRIGRASSPD